MPIISHWSPVYYDQPPAVGMWHVALINSTEKLTKAQKILSRYAGLPPPPVEKSYDW